MPIVVSHEIAFYSLRKYTFISKYNIAETDNTANYFGGLTLELLNIVLPSDFRDGGLRPAWSAVPTFIGLEKCPHTDEL